MSHYQNKVLQTKLCKTYWVCPTCYIFKFIAVNVYYWLWNILPNICCKLREKLIIHNFICVTILRENILLFTLNIQGKIYILLILYIHNCFNIFKNKYIYTYKILEILNVNKLYTSWIIYKKPLIPMLHFPDHDRYICIYLIMLYYLNNHFTLTVLG